MDDAAIQIRQTEEYARWFSGLHDRRANARMRQGRSVVVLVGGGDKGTQARDIKMARRVAEELAKYGSVEIAMAGHAHVYLD